MNYILKQQYWGNTVYQWAISVAIVFGAILAIRLFKYFVLKRVKSWSVKTSSTWDDFIVEILEGSALPLLYITAIYFSLVNLSLPPSADKLIDAAFMVAITYFVLKVLSATFKKFIHSYIHKEEDSESKEKQAAGLLVIANIFIWMMGVIFLIDNFGYNVTTLIAGLGVGGIAIALAAQTVLGDLFSYFVIFFDRPFRIGDFIAVGDKSGVIEYIGIKTTRIRTLSGEQLVCSNTDLTNSRLHNFKVMEKRRVLFSLGVTYQTGYEQLASIPDLVKEIITSKDKVQFDRAHFSGYGDFSLNFEFVYFVLDPNYNVYMDIQQDIYLNIFKEFESCGIEFAYPTQTVFFNKEKTLTESE